MYYSVKLTWLQPKEGTDEMQKISKQFLTYAESVTEAEARVVDWVPSNYQDATVDEVKKTNIGEIRALNGDSEVFWVLKIQDDGDGRSKPKPYYLVYNGDKIEDVIKIASKDWSGSTIEEVKKYKIIVDDELIAEDISALKSKKSSIKNENDEKDEDEISLLDILEEQSPF